MATDEQCTLAVLEAISLPQSLKMMTLRQTDSYCPGALALEYICLLQYAHTHTNIHRIRAYFFMQRLSRITAFLLVQVGAYGRGRNSRRRRRRRRVEGDRQFLK